MTIERVKSLLNNNNFLNNQNYFKPLEDEILTFRYVLLNYDKYVKLKLSVQEVFTEIWIFFISIVIKILNIFRFYINKKSILLILILFLGFVTFLIFYFVFYLISLIILFISNYFGELFKIQNEDSKIQLFLFVSIITVIFIYHLVMFYLYYLDFYKTKKFFLFTPKKVYFVSDNKIIKAIYKEDLYKELAKIIAINRLFKSLRLLKVLLFIRLILGLMLKTMIVVLIIILASVASAL